MDTAPTNYNLTFEPDLKKFTFTGVEIISVNCKKSVNVIRMNCAELKIKSCIVKFGGQIIKSSPKTNEKKEELEIKLGQKIRGPVSSHLLTPSQRTFCHKIEARHPCYQRQCSVCRCDSILLWSAN